jgi:hypothetical protein
MIKIIPVSGRPTGFFGSKLVGMNELGFWLGIGWLGRENTI